MMPDLHEQLAELLEYPTPGLLWTAERAADRVAIDSPAAADGVRAFAAFVASAEFRELEELFIQSFDLQATCCLDVGYQLFGENYTRGAFLVKMRQAVRAKGISPGAELPDHLPVVLRLLAALRPDEDPRGLVEEAVLPAMEKMIAAFGAKDSPYRALLRSVADWLVARWEVRPAAPAPRRLPLVAEGVVG